MPKLRSVSLSLGVLITGLVAAKDVPAPPVAPRKDHVQTWHGEKVNDPYAWLREKDAPDVVKYLEAENRYTEAMTKNLKSYSDALYKEMLGHIKQTDLSVPVRRGRYFYYARTAEGLQYSISCRKAAGPDDVFDEQAKEEVLLDQNAMAKDLKFLSIGAYSISNDANKLLFSRDVTGFRQYELFVKDLTSGKVTGPLADRVTSVAWAADNATVIFVTEDPVTKRSDTLWRTEIGGTPEKLFEEKDERFQIGVGLTKDKKFVVLTSVATDTWENSVLAADQPKGAFRVVLPREQGHKYEIEHRDGLFYIRTNKDAKNFRIVTAPLGDPSPKNWKPFVEHRKDVLLDGLEPFSKYLTVQEKIAGLARLRIYSFATGQWRDITFPEPVYSASSAGTPEFDSRQFRYIYQSLVTPSSVYDVDMETGKATLLKRREVLGGYDPQKYASERLWATARDGVKVPISIVYRKDLKRDGKSPLFLYGYGSYGFGLSATFSSDRLIYLDRGVTYAIAHIRGGDEMGETWHDDGMLMSKKNTFFDFIDCAEYLIREKWTSKDALIAEGGSAGGLLIGAVANYRPDLFKALHAAVPFVDVINTMMDSSVPLTTSEYLEWGNPNEKPAFDYMRSYSPYDNVEKKAYPAILVTTSYNDSQVMYWEPAKYVAKLRALKTDHRELLLKCKMDPAGHGGSSGRYDALKDKAFEAAWMLQQVGITK